MDIPTKNKLYSVIAKKYEILSILKETRNGLVLKVRRGDIYILKVSNKSSQSRNEIRACLYLAKHMPDFFIKLLDHFKVDKFYCLLLEYIDGKQLTEYVGSDLPRSWFHSLFLQLIRCSRQLESYKILHNDFWEDNIIIHPISKSVKLPGNIPNAGFIIKVIDYEYMHQYTENPKIVSPILRYPFKIRKQYGWGLKWHTGGDLNQIFGFLSEFQHIPADYLKYIKKHLIITSQQFKYAITRSNTKFSPTYLLSRDIFREQH